MGCSWKRGTEISSQDLLCSDMLLGSLGSAMISPSKILNFPFYLLQHAGVGDKALCPGFLGKSLNLSELLP